MKRIVAFGNPLLDTVICIGDSYLLDRYNLENDGQKEVSRNEMENLFNDIKSYNLEQSAGGCAQNTLRVMKWAGKDEITAKIFGAVGDDSNADVLRGLLHADGVKTNYFVQANRPTGLTIALVNGPYRSLVAHLGAAEYLPLDNQLSCQIFGEVPDAQLIYIEGFFLPKRIDVAKLVLDVCGKEKKTLAFNLSAKYMCEQYSEDMTLFAKSCNILFGNRREYETLSQMNGNKNIDDFISNLLFDEKIIVITDGADNVKFYRKNEEGRIDVPEMLPQEIVDTTGAGDAFVAGFLTGFIKGLDMRGCVEFGNKMARMIIGQSGCTLPKSM